MPSLRQTRLAILLLALVCVALEPAAAALARPATDAARLDGLSTLFEQALVSRRGPLYQRLLESTNPAQIVLNADTDIRLMYVDGRGRPYYYVLDNLNAAATVSTNKVWPGGGYGYSLTGSGTTLGKLAIWDGGGVKTSHQEFGGRATQMDSPPGTHFHSTHVAGTMIAAGVVPAAKGMSYQGTLAAYDWDNDLSEMASAASGGMLASNHSYGIVTGWYLSGDVWYWFGDTDVSPVEDYFFGFYGDEAQAWDQVAYAAPYYTIVKSAGNDRSNLGPGPGGEHYVWDNVLENWVLSTDTRDPDGGTDGFDSMSHASIAKNLVSVGAVDDILASYSLPGDVVMSTFSGWGPTDDGRIKPDLVANGISLYSCINTGNSSYASYSGTSMSTPNVSGSLNLLVGHYQSTHSGVTPLSSTMKAILIQTADEAGSSDGPDYAFGWGLLNTLKAADFISEDASEPSNIMEDYLANGSVDTLYITSDGLSPLRLTLAWTDPAGTPPPPSLNPATLSLVNDLDLRLKYLETLDAYYPYVLDPSNPGNAAVTGDNVRDNVEQLYVAEPTAGDYMVTVAHKGTLSVNQWYSLVSSEKLTTDAPYVEFPVVTVVQPDGGEVLAEGTEYQIKWVATHSEGIDSVTILLSLDAGDSFPVTISTGEPNDSSYTWLVPGSYSDECIVRVVAYDPNSNSGQDDSDATFTILEAIQLVPSLTAAGTVALAALVVVTGTLFLHRRRRLAREL